MSLQTAYYNQPYAAPATGPSWSTAATVTPTPAYTPTMTQMPSMPQPPFLNSTAAPVTGTQGGLSSLPDLPSPWQIAPSVMGSGSAPSYNLAQSVPVTAHNVPQVADIPPPHMVAPWLFLPRPTQMPASTNTNLNGLNGLNGQNGMQGQNPPQQPPKPPQTPPQQPQPPQPKTPSADLNGGELSDATINSLNERLNNPSEDVRADAAMDLYKILDANPSLAENQIYKPYIDAFIEKIMHDPSPVVRGAGEFILEMGKVPNPTEKVKTQLRQLSKRTGLTGEDTVTGRLLGAIESGTIRKSPQVTAPKPGQGPAGGPAQGGPQGGQAQGGQQGGQQGGPQGGQPPGGQQGGPAQGDPGAAGQQMMPQGFQPPQPGGGQQQSMQGSISQQMMQGPDPTQGGMGAYPGMNMQQPMSPQQASPMQGFGLPMQQQQQALGMAQAGATPSIGGRLNMMSSPQAMPQVGWPQNMPMMQGYPQSTGRRLNIQEGIR